MLVNGGDVINELGGELNMGDGRIELNSGATLTNNGLISSSDGGSGILFAPTATSATNNGFFDYTNSNVFARGAGPPKVTDNGIDLNDSSETTIDAGGGNTVTIANASYEYFEGANSVGTSDAMGEITFSMTLSGDPAFITNGLTGVTIKVENLGMSALPITLTSFTAKPKGDQVMVEWETATELNNDYMAVERSADGRRFDEIGRVQGAGNSNTLPVRPARRAALEWPQLLPPASGRL